jgi:L-2-hydroxyglutarate oxidase
MDHFDYAIIGGGIVGLSTAMHLGERYANARVLLLEKEGDLALHQSGRNSGVIHSGIYYKPGSLKARMARAGASSMVQFCREHDIPCEVCGKVIVATQEKELPLLDNLFRRGLENGLNVMKMTAEQVLEIEPHVRCLAGIRVPTTGITSYRQVCQRYSELVRQQGGVICLGAEVKAIRAHARGHLILSAKGEFEARFLINCSGLHSDRVARITGADPGGKIVPFRGEYYELVPERRHLVRTLIYPVPNPQFPFLGVHFTRMIGGSVHAGPNAVLAFKREGYHKTDFNLRDFAETMAFGGFWKLARRNMVEGIEEMKRSFSKALFVHSLKQLIPEIRPDDLIPCQAGVRAQALMNDGRLVDDFLIVRGRNSLHVCNAPSPAATASLEIGKEMARQVPELGSKPLAFAANPLRL